MITSARTAKHPGKLAPTTGLRNPANSELPGCEFPAPQNYRAQAGLSARHPGPGLGLGTNATRHLILRLSAQSISTTGLQARHATPLLAKFPPQLLALSEAKGTPKALQASTLQPHGPCDGSLPGAGTLPDFVRSLPLHPGFNDDGRPRSYVEMNAEWNRKLEAHFAALCKQMMGSVLEVSAWDN